MKRCSKCQRELPETEFVKSARYRDGLYPHCSDCRKKKREATLKSHPCCARCKAEPHLPNHPYCLKCQRVSRGMSPVRWTRKAKHPSLCPVCNERPKRTSQGYCYQCANQIRKAWLKSRGGAWAYAAQRGVRHKLVARAYVNHLMQRGKLKSKPCDVCGKLETEAHHNSYENPMDIRWVCAEHHDALERWKRMRQKKSLTSCTGEV